MQKKSITSRAFWVIMAAGMTTGMGNGSVFGAAMMCFLGRAKFDNWGGWYETAYNPYTFTGFIDWCMIVFGIAFCVILAAGISRHNAIENQSAA
jgi:hypothetical protein